MCVGAPGPGATVLLGATEVGLMLVAGGGALGDLTQYAVSVLQSACAIIFQGMKGVSPVQRFAQVEPTAGFILKN